MRKLSLIEKGGVYFEIFSEVYRFHRKHFNASDPDAWIMLAQEAGKLSEKYGADLYPFVAGLLHVIIDDIERAYKSKDAPP